MTPLMNPTVSALLDRICAKPANHAAASDLIELARMVQAGDLLHVDAIPAWLEAKEQQAIRDAFVDACRTAEGWPV